MSAIKDLFMYPPCVAMIRMAKPLGGLAMINVHLGDALKISAFRPTRKWLSEIMSKVCLAYKNSFGSSQEDAPIIQNSYKEINKQLSCLSICCVQTSHGWKVDEPCGRAETNGSYGYG